jgi:uncharacterized protein (TIGR02266 family)
VSKPKGPEATTLKDTVPPEVREAYEAAERERRTSVRAPVRVAVRFESGPAFTKAYAAYTSNIGAGGLCLLTNNPYEVGAPLRLHIEVAPNRTLRIDGTVAWVRAGIAMGVRFQPLDKETEAAVNALVQEALATK